MVSSQTETKILKACGDTGLGVRNSLRSLRLPLRALREH
jgi:hypothetical protein